MKARLFCLGLLLLPMAASANPNMRDWKFASGQTRRAELVSYDEKTKIATLRYEDQTVAKVNHDDLSDLDRAWLLEWIEFREEMEEKIAKMGGKLSHHVSAGTYPTAFAVYQPPVPEGAPKPPLMILFHPNGNGSREIYRYVEAAKGAGMTLVSCDTFRNAGDEAEFRKRFAEMLPQIEATVPHDPGRMFMGGCSGAACRAFHWTAKFDRPWAGVYSNCGWLGGDSYYKLPYPKMRVAMVNGINDPSGSWAVKDTEILKKAGCKVTLHAFEGGHQVPPPSVQEKAFRWLLSDE